MRIKPALGSRLLATGLSICAFAAAVSGFIQESQAISPEQSMKLSGTNSPLSPEVLYTQNPIPEVDPSSIPTAIPLPSASKVPTAKPTKTSNPEASASSPNAIRTPSSQAMNSAAPSINPSPSSVEGVAPAIPALPVSPEVDQSVPQETTVVYTCMSPGGNTREPSDSLGCPGRWGFVLTQV